MLRVHFSNHHEALLDALLEQLGSGPASVFTAEQVIVPSAALQRSVGLAIAERRGICCNVEFSFLAQWLWRQIGELLPGVAAESPFAAPVLAWRIDEIFGDAAFVAAEPRLRDYLSRADPVMRHALAERSAGLLEQYLTYRPEWLAAWSAHQAVDLGPADALQRADEHWQAALWRRVAAQLGTAREHPATTFLRALEAAPGQRLPAQLHVFGLPAMPPLYARLLQQLGRWIDLHLYVLNPCREYWFEVVDRKRLGALALRGAAGHHEIGNRLLAGWGQQTQAHIDLLLQLTDAGDDDARFVANPSGSLLGRLQNAVLELVELEAAPLAPDDRSIEVHVCHALTRELEVLQDRLLALFGADPTLQPSQVLVVTPDLESAAPLIDAVFGTAPRERALPYAITGRPRSSVNASARALLALLALLGSRFQASRVFELLQQPAVARRFELEGDALQLVHDWMRQAAIHWGLDGAQRAGFDLPALERHSFADGLHRLFLGYALPGAIDTPFHGRLPAGDAEGTQADALGAFWRFVTALEGWQRTLTDPQTADGWLAGLSAALAELLAPGDAEIDDWHDVQAALHALHDQMRAAQLAAPIPLEVIRRALQTVLDDDARGGVPGGSITFAAIGSLRGLPYRVVCAIGLDDGAFPSTTRPAEFDLMALRPQRGDRQRRHDERNLFLDLLLAARERLHLSYTGRSVLDNAPLPASVLVAELIDYLVPAIAADDSTAARAAARARLVVAHPLQPFAPQYYSAETDPRLRSHNTEYAEALRLRPQPAAGRNGNAGRDGKERNPRDDTGGGEAGHGDIGHGGTGRNDAVHGDTGRNEVGHGATGRNEVGSHGLGSSDADDAASEDDFDLDDEQADRLAAERDLATLPPFFTQPLATPGAEWRQLSLDQLTRFFRNPSRYLLERRLGLALARDAEELQDDEPFVPDFRARGLLAERLLPQLLQGADRAALWTLACAGGEYPAGRLGERLLERELQALERYARGLRQASAEACHAAPATGVTFELEGETWRLDAAWPDLRASGLLRHRYDDLRARDRLEAWLAHLLLCAARPAGVALHTAWHARDGVLHLPAAEGAHETLQALVRLYRQGLMRPLHFYPKSAWSYIEKDGSQAMASATWRGGRYRVGEATDAAYRLALRGIEEPLDSEFEACARAVFGTLRECLQAA